MLWEGSEAGCQREPFKAGQPWKSKPGCCPVVAWWCFLPLPWLQCPLRAGRCPDILICSARGHVLRDSLRYASQGPTCTVTSLNSSQLLFPWLTGPHHTRALPDWRLPPASPSGFYSKVIYSSQRISSWPFSLKLWSLISCIQFVFVSPSHIIYILLIVYFFYLHLNLLSVLPL